MGRKTMVDAYELRVVECAACRGTGMRANNYVGGGSTSCSICDGTGKMVRAYPAELCHHKFESESDSGKCIRCHKTVRELMSDEEDA